MWEMILKYAHKDEARVQLQELEKNGIEYFDPISNFSKKEKHYNFLPLEEAFENHFMLYSDNIDDSDSDDENTVSVHGPY